MISDIAASLPFAFTKAHDGFIEQSPVVFGFPHCPSLALAGPSIVFIVVLKTKKRQVVGGTV